ncbi:hypothetical protein GRS96_05420 [Rathayibacter sp. VKM Ac-2803]|uniref:hypothetical protein n=1 Tax=unclassified Rathayibacter TaxID=2609250 RepID=UPI00135819A9|nr:MULTISPECIES: hypothetical protein [unclassified Rathayibacter]MWV48718.1 hypothetical protein [Rathayibacter sp. VKM Ac-2803]MWV60325.1 hypothetical protein [Rathayibacter sp. VKM Ac-2754]
MTGAPEPSRPRLSREDASSRITAYVYGNIVTLATIAPLTTVAAENGQGFWYVLATAFSTFLAHTFAESIGRRARTDERLSAAVLRAELRDSLPVLTSGILPAAVLGLAWLTAVPGSTAEIIALTYLVIRLALIGPIVARIRGERPSFRTFVAGIVLALVGIAVALVKVGLGS